MDKVVLELNSSEVRLVLEACRGLERRWMERARTMQDKDEQADLSNEAGYLASVRGYIEDAAVDVFGATVKEFSREAA